MNLGSVELTPLQVYQLELQRRNRVKTFRHDFKAFCYYYFPHYFFSEPSVLHEDMFVELAEAVTNGEPDNIAKAAPRGNAKSTIATFALPIWCYVYKLKHYILIVSDTTDQATDFLANIRSEIEDNEKLREDFGELFGSVWTTTQIVNQDDDVRVEALGSGKRVRGRRFKQWRPDLIICDDIENDENVESADQRKKDRSWYYKALSKAGDDRTDKIFIGTIMHVDSLLISVLNNPTYKSKIYKSVIKWSNSKLWDEWEKIVTNLENPHNLRDARQFFEDNKAQMLEGTKVLWPEREPYYDLMLLRVADGPAAFASEKQNEPISEDDRRFLRSWIQYYDDSDIAGKKLQVYGFVDPSLGKQGGDYSAIISIGVDENDYIYVLDADIQKRHPNLIIIDTLAAYLKYEHIEMGVEEVQFQEFFKDIMIAEAAKQEVEITIKGVRQVRDKILRIQSLQPDVKNGRIKFRRDQQELINQLVDFPSATHDDGPDALEGVVSLAGKRSAIADYYKESINGTKNPVQSFIKNATIQGLIR